MKVCWETIVDIELYRALQSQKGKKKTKLEVAAPHHHTMTRLAFHSQCVGRTFLHLTFMMSK